MQKQIYLDYNASTPIAPDVAAAMRPYVDAEFGNPSSGHWASTTAKRGIERARQQVAVLLGCTADEIVFTSGGTEANNLALKGVFFTCRERGNHIITSQVEHPAILNPCRFLERLGATVTYLPVDHSGRVDPDDVRRALTPQTVLVSIMHANNEVGTIQPIEEIARIAREHGALMHTDAAQSVGKIPTNVQALNVDLLTVAGHKLYAPKGVGALYIRRGLRLEPLLHGAGHESGRRAGTESAILTVALGAAAAYVDLTSIGRIKALRDRLWKTLRERFGDGIVLNGHPEHRLPNTLNVSFPGLVGPEILARIPELAASTGSACHAGTVELSPVLKAMGVEPHVGMGAIRLSLGRPTTEDDIRQAAERLAEAARAYTTV